MPLTSTARIAFLTLVVATASGCSSNSQSGPANIVQDQPVAQLQDPAQVPCEKWSAAMVILRKDMGIVGQTDIPLEEVNNEALITAQRNAWLPGTVMPAGGAALSATGYAAPPTGFSAAGAAGMGLALGFLTAPPPSGPAGRGQIAAWVPEDLAASMEEAVQVATKAYKDARIKAFARANDMALPASRYPAGYSPTKMYRTFADVALSRPVPPIGGPVEAPSFLPPGRYFGPIFFDRHTTQMGGDRVRNKLDRQATYQALSKAVPDWFVIYNPGLPKLKSQPGEPPVIYHKGQAHFFVSK